MYEPRDPWYLKFNPVVFYRRRKFYEHLKTHQCASVQFGGFSNCDEAMQIFHKLPKHDQVVIA